MSQLKVNEPSLMIVTASASIKANVFQEQIESLGLGEVERVDLPGGRIFTKGTHSKCMRQVYIHFKNWSEDVSMEERLALANGLKELRVNYDGTNYWRIRGVEYKSKETVMREKEERGPGLYEFVDVENV